MGSICSKRSAVDKSPSDVTLGNGRRRDHGKVSSPSQLKSCGNLKSSPAGDAGGKRFLEQSFSFSEGVAPNLGSITHGVNSSGQPALIRVLSEKSSSTKSRVATGAKSGTQKVSEVINRAGTLSFGMAVDALDTLGSSMTSLSLNGGFSSGVVTKGNKISILAFEVANTIVKGANLMHSLSEENIKNLKEVVLPSEAVQHLVSNDMDELLKIAAADKREELKVFCGEVVRFGNRCKDPQWHNLDRYFEKLGSEITPRKQLKEQAAGVLQQLLTLVQYTAELYHELHTFDRFDQDYRRKLQEDENSSAIPKGDSFQYLRQELKAQQKHVKSLKKKSLWFRNLEEILEKLVDIVHFMHFEIHEAFGSAGRNRPVTDSLNNHTRLGPAGLALHYANVINQIDTLVSRSGSVLPNTRDSLYQNLPPVIRSALRGKLQDFRLNEELTAPHIKAEMEKTLQWLVPIANNTSKTDATQKAAGQSTLLRIETLYHADKDITEAHILDLIVLLHRFISLSRRGGRIFASSRSPIKSPLRSSSQRGSSPASLLLNKQIPATSTPFLTHEDQEMLGGVEFQKRTPGISRSQDFDSGRRPKLICHNRLSRSSSSSSATETKNEARKMNPVIDFDINRIKALDVIDRVDSIRK
ncbi:hypothetical protein AXF42_Ash013536 [Apostasia shenzhenica]|uniref:DUF668 domain-containing protein n=1 Tax=Apostasia shenzhenica TaxID=1088818 RepID=A0A2I0AP69_9ASPA|nr:hypothetical protein AXF42_Ash013536 [Apostasia shenzhenica]